MTTGLSGTAVDWSGYAIQDDLEPLIAVISGPLDRDANGGTVQLSRLRTLVGTINREKHGIYGPGQLLFASFDRVVQFEPEKRVEIVLHFLRRQRDFNMFLDRSNIWQRPSYHGLPAYRYEDFDGLPIPSTGPMSPGAQ